MRKTDPVRKPDNARHLRIRLRLGAGVLAMVLLMGGLMPLRGSAQGLTSPENQPELSNPFTRGLQGLFGLNRLAGWIGSKVIEKEIRRKVEGDLDVRLKTYSGMDLADGKARGLEIDGQDLIYHHAFYVTEFHLKTREETPLWIDLDSGKLKSPVNADVTVRLTDADLNRSFQTEDVKKLLGNIKVKLMGGDTQHLRVLEPWVAFENDRVHFKARVAMEGTSDDKAMPLDLTSGVTYNPQTGLIELKDLSLAPINGVQDTSMMDTLVAHALEKFLKPSKLVPMKGGKLDLQAVTVSQGNLNLEGQVTLYPKSASPSS